MKYEQSGLDTNEHPVEGPKEDFEEVGSIDGQVSSYIQKLAEVSFDKTRLYEVKKQIEGFILYAEPIAKDENDREAIEGLKQALDLALGKGEDAPDRLAA